MTSPDKMNLLPAFQYQNLGHFTCHLLNDPAEFKNHPLNWIMPEWELDRNEAPHEHWTVEWMQV